MTLAEHLAEHLRPRDGFGAIPGPRFSLRSLIPLGKTIELRTGVSVQIPYTPLTWNTKNLADGGVQMLFTSNELPRVVADTSLLTVSADITGFVLRTDCEACQLELQLRGWPDIRLSLDLDA